MTIKKVLLVIPNLGTGGAQRVFHQQLSLLNKSFLVTGCVFNWDGATAADREPGIISLDVAAGRSWPGKLINFYLRIRRLRSIKRALNIDICISHLEGADYVNVLSRGREKIVLWVHGTKQNDGNITGVLGWLRLKILIPFFYRRADRVVTVSDGIRIELTTFMPGIASITRTIHNGLDLESIMVKAQEPLRPHWDALFRNHIVVFAHCRLGAQKNLSALISIIAQLKNRTDIKWVIAGDGDERASLLSQCVLKGIQCYDPWEQSRWDVSNQIFFAGDQLNPFSFLARARLYIMTSLWEGFPLALCEAIACCVPVIVPDCPTGPGEIMTGGLAPAGALPSTERYGILMPMIQPDDVQMAKLWAGQIERVCDDEALRTNFIVNARVDSGNFSLEKVASEVETALGQF